MCSDLCPVCGFAFLPMHANHPSFDVSRNRLFFFVLPSKNLSVPPGIICVFRNGYISMCEDGWIFACMGAIPPSSHSFLLPPPPPPLAPAWSSSLSLTFFCLYLWGVLCWLRQFAPGTSFAVWKRSCTQRRVAENEMGKNERAGAKIRLQWRWGDVLCTSCL